MSHRQCLLTFHRAAYLRISGHYPSLTSSTLCTSCQIVCNWMNMCHHCVPGQHSASIFSSNVIRWFCVLLSVCCKICYWISMRRMAHKSNSITYQTATVYSEARHENYLLHQQWRPSESIGCSALSGGETWMANETVFLWYGQRDKLFARTISGKAR